MHNPLTSLQLEHLLSSDAAAGLSDVARERLGWIRYFVQHGFSVSETCVHLNISRSTFHRWLDRFDPDDLTSLEEKSHVPHSLRTAIVPDAVVTLIRAYRHAHPLMGKEQIRIFLEQEHHLDISASTIGRVIERECLYFAATPLHWKKRMHLEEQNAGQSAPTTTESSTVQTHSPAPVRATEAQEDTGHSCMLCKVAGMNWLQWKTVVVAVSIMINIAIATMFLATISIESGGMAAKLSATHTTTTTTLSDIDHP